MRKDEAKSILLKTIPCPYKDNEKICHHLQEGGGDCESCYEEALDTILNLVETLEGKIKSLQYWVEELKKEKRDNLMVVYGGRRFGTEGMIVKDYISKDKIREKIKEYDKWIKEGGDYTESLEAQRYALKELLEENTNEWFRWNGIRCYFVT